MGSLDTAPKRADTEYDLLFKIAASVSTSGGLVSLVESGGYELTTITRDSDGVIVSAAVRWPDGTSGVFTTTQKNTTFLEIDAYTVTYLGSTTITVTQSAVTRDSDGNVIVKPVLTIS